jgi:hypothetical protein
MGVAKGLEKAQGLLASGDVPGLLRHLRGHGEALPLGEVARLVAGAARLAGFDDLAQAAAAAAGAGDGSGAQEAWALYDFGFACLERGAGYLASGRWPARSNWRRTPRRYSASSSRPWNTTGSTRAPSPCSRTTSR